MDKTIKTYEPDNSIKNGYLSIFSEIFCELKDNRWLCYQLFKRDFLATYKQSFIGIFWAFIIPLIAVGTFIILRRSGVFSVGDIGLPYPIYAVFGLAFWQLFATGVAASSNSLVKAGPMIAKINFSKKSLVISSCGQAMVSFVMQIILLVILFIYFRIMPSIAILLIPITIIPIMLLTLGAGFILSLLNGVFRDIGNILSIIITFLFFITPVLYEKPVAGILAQITEYNILYYLITAPRELALKGTISEGKGFLFASIISAAIFVVCLVVFHLTETRLAERI